MNAFTTCLNGCSKKKHISYVYQADYLVLIVLLGSVKSISYCCFLLDLSFALGHK